MNTDEISSAETVSGAGSAPDECGAFLAGWEACDRKWEGPSAAGYPADPDAAWELFALHRPALLGGDPGLMSAMREACDLLAERTYGSPARSPGHNARLTLEATLSKAEAHSQAGTADRQGQPREDQA
jgi:hypothetical protein